MDFWSWNKPTCMIQNQVLWCLHDILTVVFTGWKVSVFGVFLIRYFPHSDWIRRNTRLYPVLMRENRTRKSPNTGIFYAVIYGQNSFRLTFTKFGLVAAFIGLATRCISLKELQSYNWKSFLCPSQKTPKTTAGILAAVFKDMSTLRHIKVSIYIWKTKSTSHKQYFLVFFSLEMQIRLIQTKVYCQVFYSGWKETTHESSIMYELPKKIFPVCIISVQLASMNVFLFSLMTGKHCVFYKVYRYSEVFSTAMLLVSYKQAFWIRPVF